MVSVFLTLFTLFTFVPDGKEMCIKPRTGENLFIAIILQTQLVIYPLTI